MKRSTINYRGQREKGRHFHGWQTRIVARSGRGGQNYLAFNSWFLVADQYYHPIFPFFAYYLLNMPTVLGTNLLSTTHIRNAPLLRTTLHDLIITSFIRPVLTSVYPTYSQRIKTAFLATEASVTIFSIDRNVTVQRRIKLSYTDLGQFQLFKPVFFNL